MTDKVCSVDGCNAPRYKSESRCHPHMQQYWRESRGSARHAGRQTPVFSAMSFQAGDTLMIELIDFVSGRKWAFQAVATGESVVIPETEEGFARMNDLHSDKANVMLALPVRRGNGGAA